MNLIHYQENKESSAIYYRQNFPSDAVANNGLVVLEAEPQVRSLFVTGEDRFSIGYYDAKTQRIPLPYVYFFVKYQRVGNEFVYNGLGGYGLRVFFSPTKIESLDDVLCHIPTERGRLGTVCTVHTFDGKRFSSMSKLVDFVVSHWYGLHHDVRGYNFFEKPWNKMTLEEVLNPKSYTGCGFERLRMKAFSIRELARQYADAIDPAAIMNREKWGTNETSIPSRGSG